MCCGPPWHSLEQSRQGWDEQAQEGNKPKEAEHVTVFPWCIRSTPVLRKGQLVMLACGAP